MANLGYIQLTRDCPQNCRFCSNPPSCQELTEEQLESQIQGLAELGYFGVVLTGGEPTASPLLEPALRFAKERGLHCRMITNGQKLADRQLFSQLVNAGLQHIHISLHSYRPEVHDFLTRCRGSYKNLTGALEHVPAMGITCDINTVINTYNADHLHETVLWILGAYPFIRHFVWNNMDPGSNRVRENPDCIPRLHEMQLPLQLAMEHLDSVGCSFRAERVPLCFMPHFAWASTETRKIIKAEERCTHFLDSKRFVRQQEFVHDKFKTCEICQLDPICAGLFASTQEYDPAELSPIFDSPWPIVRKVMGRQLTPDLRSRIEARRHTRQQFDP